jgi:hypothetical protein
VSTALIALAPNADTGRAGHGRGRPQAEFLTQLIAAKTRAPQTLARRRAEPDEAIAAYDAANGRPLPAGRSLSRSL